MHALTSLKVIQQNRQSLRLLAIILDNNTRGADDLPCIALTINDTQSGPFAQFLAISNLDQVDVVFGTEGFDEFVVGLRVA
jgi:hypothetical protein